MENRDDGREAHEHEHERPERTESRGPEFGMYAGCRRSYGECADLGKSVRLL